MELGEVEQAALGRHLIVVYPLYEIFSVLGLSKNVGPALSLKPLHVPQARLLPYPAARNAAAGCRIHPRGSPGSPSGDGPLSPPGFVCAAGMRPRRRRGHVLVRCLYVNL